LGGGRICTAGFVRASGGKGQHRENREKGENGDGSDGRPVFHIFHLRIEVCNFSSILGTPGLMPRRHPRGLTILVIERAAMDLDIRIINAATRGTEDKLVQIGIRDGRYVKIADSVPGDPSLEIDAEGNLVTESFVNGHLHLDKVYTLEKAGQDALGSYHGAGMGGAMRAIEQASRIKESYDESWIIENVRRAADLAVKYGNTHIRAFADVDTKGRLEGVKALIRAREEYRDRVEIQVVAFPQDGVVRDPGAADWVRQAMDLGADVVGGIPWIEFSEEDMRSHVDQMFELAKRYNKDVSMLVDDAGDSTLRTLEYLTVQTIKYGWQGRVTAQHARAMALYEEPVFRRLTALMKKGGVSLVSDPQTGPLHA
jgi:cytosine deaminase